MDESELRRVGLLLTWRLGLELDGDSGVECKEREGEERRQVVEYGMDGE